METQAMTLRLPKELYERLRLEAFEKHISQAEIIREALTERYERTDEAWPVPGSVSEHMQEQAAREGGVQ
jgi:predicted DNA-binding protein